MKIIWIVILLTCALSLNVKSQEIEFDTNFKKVNDAKIPYGESFQFVGKLTSAPDSLIVTISYQVLVSDGTSSLKKIKKPATINNLEWSVSFENPLPADANISIHFDLFTSISEDDKNHLSNELKLNLESVAQDLLEGKISLNNTPEETKVILASLFIDKLSLNFKEYRVENNKSLYQAISDWIRGINSWSDLSNYAINARSVKQFLKNYNNDLSTINLEKIIIRGRNSSDYKVIGESILGDENFLPDLDTIFKKVSNEEKNIIDRYIKLYKGGPEDEKGIKKRLSEVAEFNGKILNQPYIYVNNSYSAESKSESTQSNELLKYAGIDMAAVVFPKSKDDSNPAFVGYYFLLSPYLHEIFGYTPPKRWLSNLTPTIGWGLSSSLAEVKTPFFYTGCSYRVNAAFRFTAGATFFKNDNTKPEFEWMFGAGFALQLSSVGDLIRLFNAAKAQFPSSNQQSTN
jgi:hypothetical protein